MDPKFILPNDDARTSDITDSSMKTCGISQEMYLKTFSTHMSFVCKIV